ncbi:MAG: transcription elongation factor GreA [Armatimonadota bacterium]
MLEQTSEMDVLLSSTGLKKIEQELERLKTIDRKRVAERIREAKAFGDFAENSEYDDAKNEQAFIEGRIDELNAILKHAAIIDETGIPVDHVGIGSVVRVKDLETLEEWEYRIVGAFEANPALDSISNESPIGGALLNARTGDIIEVSVPAGIARYEIVDIHR